MTDLAADPLPRSGPRRLDERLLGLEPDPGDPGRLSFVVVPHLCRSDGRLYGGAALAASLAAAEVATGRPALWSTTQLVAVADHGDRVHVDVEVAAAGRAVHQVQVRGRVGGRLVFSAVGATATPGDAGLRGTGPHMPRVPPPDDCERWRGPGGVTAGDGSPAGVAARPEVGHHLVTEHRDAPLLDAGDARPGRMALWARLTGDVAPDPPVTTPAMLGFVADLVPLAVCRAAGVVGVGTSLDNSLRVGEPVDTEWVLIDLEGQAAVGGLGHGQVHLWSPDGRLLGTGSQSARLFRLEDFLRRSGG